MCYIHKTITFMLQAHLGKRASNMHKILYTLIGYMYLLQFGFEATQCLSKTLTTVHFCLYERLPVFMCVHELGKGLYTIGGLDYWTDRFSFKTHI